jgi:DNA-binding transcriptional regulator YiaG
MVTQHGLVHIVRGMKRFTVTDRAMQLREWIETGRARQLREAAGVSQAVAAQDCEVTQGAVVRWEKGTRMPRGRNIIAYHQFLIRLAEQARAGEAS